MNVVLCWHMHQPYYREGLNGKYHLPWVYLHGIKDYTDMATHLENHPEMRAVVNFSPILLEQLDDYVKELHTVLHQERSLSSKISDPILALLCGVEEIPEGIEERKQIVENCKRCYAPRLIDPYPAFKRLINCMEDALEKSDDDDHTHFPLSYLQDQYFIDLLMWYHLAWLGHSVKQTEVAQRLLEKGHGFTLDDRCQLVSLIYDSLAGIIPRYKRLADEEQIELSVTPYAHPIIPLLNNFDNMRCSLPDAPAPQCENYPDGWSRSRWHMDKGLKVFEKYFGRRPQGVWLSEGGVSPDALQLLQEYDIKWTATGEAVWQNTCNITDCTQGEENARRRFFKPYQYNGVGDGKGVKIYFRDDGLSDLIGFEYSHWNAEDAARNFEENLENISTFLGTNKDEHVVSIILDGENAWEYYLDNGYPFLDALYRKISNNYSFKMTTFAEVSKSVEAIKIDNFCSGSWVYGSFSTWIGQEDKNRAWEYLVEVKKVYDQKISNLTPEKQEEAELQLAICEGSDWFWWFGEYNSSQSVSDFDRLFRVQLKLMYEILGVEPPEVLNHAISVGGGDSENAGTMRRNK